MEVLILKRYFYVVLMLIIGTSLMACSSNKLEVSFDSMGGSQVESVKVEDGKTISMPDVTREGYVLEGWYTSLDDGETLNEEWLFDSDTVTEDITLYAKWDIEGFVFDQETGSITGYNGKVRDVIIPSEINGTPVTSIGDYAFSGSFLSSVTIPDSVTKIGDNAFYYNRLTSLTVPDSVTTIGEGAFFGNDLESITILGDETRFNEDWTMYGYPAELHQEATNFNGFLFVDDSNKIIGYIGDDKDIVIPSEINGTEVTSIGYGAFYDNELTGVTIPDSITIIESYAFYDNEITSITIPDGVTTLGNRVFYLNSLTSVIIPNSVITIGSKAFAANDITSITIPESVTTIGYEAFSSSHMHITSATSITILGDETRFDDDWVKIGLPAEHNPRAINVNGLIFYGDTNTIIGYVGDNKDIAIPSEINGIEVKHIGFKAFSFNKLTSVIIPDSVITIGAYAFFTNDLTSVVIPNSVTSIGEWAFYYNSLTSITLSESLTTIGDYAFSNNSIRNFTFPDSVTTIGDYAFEDNRITTLIIPDSITTIGNNAFDINPLITITILGDETRFNDDWEYYGFLDYLKPEA
jgi:uncharacterized repeat protein (TIGR02543 family)